MKRRVVDGPHPWGDDRRRFICVCNLNALFTANGKNCALKRRHGIAVQLALKDAGAGSASARPSNSDAGK
jgi:hypothetical protein